MDGLRKWSKEMNVLRWKAEMVMSSKFDYKWIKHSSIDWEWSEKLLKRDLRETSEEDSQIRSFMIKNYLQNLPTLAKLNNRYDKLYASGECIRCKEKIEDWHHIWTCKSNDMTLADVIEGAAKEIWKVKKEEMPTNEKVELERALREGLNKNSNVGEGKNVTLVLRGLIPKEISDKKIIRKYKEEVIRICYETISEVYEKIWKTRCKRINEWEKEKGITRQMKTIEKNTYKSDERSLVIGKAKEREKEMKREAIRRRWMGCALKNGINADKVWQLNRIDDILNNIAYR